MRSARWPCPAACFVVVLLATPPALGQSDVDACAVAFERTQRLRSEGRLRQAHAEAIRCAQSTCPEVLRRDCGRWTRELDASIPTVVIDARDAAGHVVADVRVEVDGALLTDRLDGRALPVDPGRRSFRVVGSLGTVQSTMVVLEGVRSQRLAVAFPTEISPSPPVRKLPWILAGAGTVALGTAAIFGVRGLQERSDLRGSCAPFCPPDRRSGIKRDLLIADLALAGGLLAWGGAAWLWLSPPNTGTGVAVNGRF